MRLLDWELAGDDGGASLVTVLDDFEKIGGRLGGERLKSDVVNHEYVDSSPGGEQPRQPAVDAGNA